jgi:hypothetical protein
MAIPAAAINRLSIDTCSGRTAESGELTEVDVDAYIEFFVERESADLPIERTRPFRADVFEECSAHLHIGEDLLASVVGFRFEGRIGREVEIHIDVALPAVIGEHCAKMNNIPEVSISLERESHGLVSSRACVAKCTCIRVGI